MGEPAKKKAPAAKRAPRAPRAKAVPPPPPATTVERVAQLLASLRQAGPLDTHDELLGQQATRLAEILDEVHLGPIGERFGEAQGAAALASSAASVNRELRATVADLMKGRDVDDDDEFFAGMPAKVWDTPESRPPNAG